MESQNKAILRHLKAGKSITQDEARRKFGSSRLAARVYDLICLDITMPELDGIEVLKTIRKKEKEMNLFNDEKSKIIMTTAVTQKEKVKAAVKEGCDSFIVKPIIKQKLISEIRNLGLLY